MHHGVDVDLGVLVSFSLNSYQVVKDGLISVELGRGMRGGRFDTIVSKIKSRMSCRIPFAFWNTFDIKKEEIYEFVYEKMIENKDGYGTIIFKRGEDA